MSLCLSVLVAIPSLWPRGFHGREAAPSRVGFCVGRVRLVGFVLGLAISVSVHGVGYWLCRSLVLHFIIHHLLFPNDYYTLILPPFNTHHCTIRDLPSCQHGGRSCKCKIQVRLSISCCKVGKRQMPLCLLTYLTSWSSFRNLIRLLTVSLLWNPWKEVLLVKTREKHVSLEYYILYHSSICIVTNLRRVSFCRTGVSPSAS